MRDMSLLPPRALAMVPLLMVPVLIGGLWLVFARDAVTPRVMVVFGTIAFAWYLLGGMLTASRISWELRLRRDLRRAQPALNAAHEPAWLVDPHGKVLAQNDAASKAEDLVGRPVSIMVGRFRAMPEAVVTSALNRMQGRNTARIDLGNGVAIAATRATGALVQQWQLEDIRDIPETPVKATGADFHALPVALLRLSSTGAVVDANASACRMLGDDMIGRPVSHYLDGPGRPFADWLRETLESQSTSRPEVLVTQATHKRFLQVSLSSEDEHHAVAVLLDVSAVKTLEAQVAQSQKMQAVGQLAGGIAHDFNNLLTAISGHCDLLMLRRDEGDQDFADLRQIEVNTNRAAALVRQLLAFSRKQTLNPEVFDLRDTLSDLTHLLNRLVGERITLSFSHDPGLRPVRADKRQFEQIIMNLVVNSRDAMQNGGEITVETRNLVLASDEVRDKVRVPKGEYVVIVVRDQGEGIPADLVQKIFEPFFTTKRQGEGTGLGLSTVYGIVKQTGGYVFCDSKMGEGAVFTIYFPASSGKPREIDGSHAKTGAITRVIEKETAYSVLLAEDEAPVRAFAARALRLRGFEVHEAANGEDALEIAADPMLAIDLFVTDVMMPGLDGPGWVEQALKTRPETPVIFMSGYTDGAIEDADARIKSAGLLQKPFSLSELVGRVEHSLKKRPKNR